MQEAIKKLSEIQRKLKAPKSNKNTFGNYMYRSCEDILEAVKPLLGEAALMLSDDVKQVGDRIYIAATATLHYQGESISSTAYAREAEVKKGMDDSQITGTASSYARKYALNGLFAIDDTKDADPQDNREQTTKTKEQNKHAKELIDLLIEGHDEEACKFWRSLGLNDQQTAWKEIDKETQKHLKNILSQNVVTK